MVDLEASHRGQGQHQDQLPEIFIETGTGSQTAKPFLARARLDSKPRHPSPTFAPHRGHLFDRIPTVIGPHPIVKLWEAKLEGRDKTICEMMTAIIQEGSPSAIVVLRNGFVYAPDEEQYPTIHLFVREDTMTMDQAAKMASKAANYIFQFEPLRDLSVEVLEGTFGHHTSSTTELRSLSYYHSFEQSFKDTLTPGVGLGLSDRSDGTATLGCYIKLVLRPKTCPEGQAPKEETVWFALTAHHALSVLNTKQQTGATLTAEEEYELQRFNANTRLTGFDPHLGTVYCASGHSSSICSPGQLWPSSTILHDWGLVKLHPKRAQGLGQMTSGLTFPEISEFKNIIGSVQKTRYLQPHNGISPIDELKQGLGAQGSIERMAFKIGSTTGPTCGAINDIDARVFGSHTYNQEQDTCELSGSTILLVSPLGSKSSCYSGACFGAPGDSGSMVYDYQGRYLACYWGGQFKVGPRNPFPSSADGIHFAQRIDTIFDGIEEMIHNDPAYEGYEKELVFFPKASMSHMGMEEISYLPKWIIRLLEGVSSLGGFFFSFRNGL